MQEIINDLNRYLNTTNRIPSVGLCAWCGGNLNNHVYIRAFYDAMLSWPKHSGVIDFPIKVEGTRQQSDSQFSRFNSDIVNGDYFEFTQSFHSLRKELAQHIINELTPHQTSKANP